MAIIKIGSSDVCDIKFSDNVDSLWATISNNDNMMLVLQITSPNVVCYVNGNLVNDTYWIIYGDNININGFILDWIHLRELLFEKNNISDWNKRNNTIRTDEFIPAPCIYGPPNPIRENNSRPYSPSSLYGPRNPISENKTPKYYQPLIYGPPSPSPKKIMWKLLLLILAVLFIVCIIIYLQY